MECRLHILVFVLDLHLPSGLQFHQATTTLSNPSHLRSLTLFEAETVLHLREYDRAALRSKQPLGLHHAHYLRHKSMHVELHSGFGDAERERKGAEEYEERLTRPQV